MPKKALATAASRRDDDVVVNVRFSAADAAKLRAGADREARTMTNFVRLTTLLGLAEYAKDPQALLKSHTH